MARITRSCKRKASPTATPTKPVKRDADTPIESIETAIRNKHAKGPYQRRPRKKRPRDVKYKIKKRRQQSTGNGEALASLTTLTKAGRETRNAGLQGNDTAQKLADVVLEQRAEISRLEKQLNNGGSNKAEDAVVASAPSNDSTQPASQHQQHQQHQQPQTPA